MGGFPLKDRDEVSVPLRGLPLLGHENPPTGDTSDYSFSPLTRITPTWTRRLCRNERKVGSCFSPLTRITPTWTTATNTTAPSNTPVCFSPLTRITPTWTISIDIGSIAAARVSVPLRGLPLLGRGGYPSGVRDYGRFSPLTRITPTWTHYRLYTGSYSFLVSVPLRGLPLLGPPSVCKVARWVDMFQSPYEDYPYLDSADNGNGRATGNGVSVPLRGLPLLGHGNLGFNVNTSIKFQSPYEDYPYLDGQSLPRKR